MYSPQQKQYGNIVVWSNQHWVKEFNQLPKVVRSRKAAISMKTQRNFLNHARKALVCGDTKQAKSWLLWWETERAYHAHLLGHFDHVAV